MRNAILIILLFALAHSPVRAVEVEAAADISFTLVDTFGTPSSAYEMPPSHKAALDLLFKPNIPATYQGYTSWAIEVSDPTKNLLYQMELDGQVPGLVHWDGFFTATEPLHPGQGCYVRLLLVYGEQRLVASVWSPFSVRSEKKESVAKTSDGSLNLFMVPSGGVYGILVSTASGKSAWLPNVSGDLRLMIRDRHAVGLRVEGTSTILFNFTLPEKGLFYSDVSMYYRYRLVGHPARFPIIPFVPDYGKGTAPVAVVGRELFGAARNLEVGARLFSTTLRGFPDTLIDLEYARNIQGMAANIYFDESLWPFRFFVAAELGYTLFRGKMLTMGGEAGFTYERIPTIIPGFFVRFQRLSGTTAADPFDGRGGVSASVSNTILMGGMRLSFRI